MPKILVFLLTVCLAADLQVFHGLGSASSVVLSHRGTISNDEYAPISHELPGQGDYYHIEIRGERHWKLIRPSGTIESDRFTLHYFGNELYHVDYATLSKPGRFSIGMTNVSRSEMELAAKPKLEVKRDLVVEEEKTFFQKYWMYIIGISVVLLIR